MKLNVRLMNDVSDLYNEVPKENNGDFECPVCGKVYKTRAGIFKHMKEQDCAPAHLVFKGTATETVAHDLYAATVSQFMPRARKTLQAFRKSKVYKPYLRFALHGMQNKLDVALLFEWILEKKKPMYVNAALSLGLKKSITDEFRMFLKQNPDLIPSEQFYESYKEDMKIFPDFLVRSLEKAQISIKYLHEVGFFNEVDVTNYPEHLKDRLMTIIGESE